ncbi:arylamine N-acetyltransferase [Cytobacillus sp. Hm23]
MNQQQLPNWACRYLERLNLTPPSTASYEFLELFSKRHLSFLPFENVSKLIYSTRNNSNGYFIPSVEQYVDNLFKYDFGGTCFVLNPYALQLLTLLGYDCYHVRLGESHIAILVQLPDFPDERLYLDFGSAAPIMKPVRFENMQNSSSFGADDIQLIPDDEQQGYYRFTRFRHGKFVNNHWSFNPNIRSKVGDFDEAIHKSYSKDAIFMTRLRVNLFQFDKGRTLSLINNKLTITTLDDKEIVRKLKDIEEVESIISEEFMLPKLPVRKAINLLRDLGTDIFHVENS